MATLTIDGVSLEIQDTSSLALIKGAIDKRDQEISALNNRVSESKQDGKYKVGEAEKEYTDMDSLYTDMNHYYQDMLEKYTDMCGKYKDMENQLDMIKTKYGDAKGKTDALEAELAAHNDEAKLLDLVKERRVLERQASRHLELADEKLDAMKDREIKEAVILAHYDFSDLKERNDSEINGMFTIACAKQTSGERVDSLKDKLNNLVQKGENPFDTQKENLDAISDAYTWVYK